MIKTLCATAAALSALTVAAPASAAVYFLGMENGTHVTIDTDRATGSWIGSQINATFSGAGLANFSVGEPGANGSINLPLFAADVTVSPGSTITGNDGTSYHPNPVQQQMFKVEAGNVLNLWSFWGTTACPTCQNIGDYRVAAINVRSSSWPSSSGGTEVPEPGMLGLLGFGLAGLALIRRRPTAGMLRLGARLA